MPHKASALQNALDLLGVSLRYVIWVMAEEKWRLKELKNLDHLVRVPDNFPQLRPALDLDGMIVLGLAYRASILAVF